MSSANTYLHQPILPWTETEFDRRFNKILAIILLAFIIIGIVIPFMPRPEVERQDLKQVSPRLAKLILQKKTQPVPLPPKPKAPEKIEKKVEKKEVKKEISPETKKTIDKTQQARKTAQRSGLLAMQDDLADLRDSFDLTAIKNSTAQQNKGKNRTANNNELLLSANATKGSGGINTSNLSRSTTGTALTQRKSTQVNSQIQTYSNNGADSTNHKPTRSQEEIELVFQKNKSAIYSLYNRALRTDPTLQGKVLLELTIAPGGEITRIRIISSELKSPELEKRLLSRIKLFKFSSQNVDTVTVTYPIDFLPS